MEKIIENIKNTYLFETWERRKIEKKDMYFPAILILSERVVFVILRRVEHVKIMG